MKRKHKILPSIFTVFMLCVMILNAQTSPIYNLSFEKKGINLQAPLNWEFIGSEHIYTLDSATTIEGKHSISIKSKSRKADVNDAAFLVNRIQAKPFIGSQLKLTGSLRTAESKRGFAQLYILVQKNGLTIQSAYSWEQRISGTTNWTANSVSLTIDSSADQILLGLMFRGSGHAWFDDLRLHKNGIAVDEEKIFPSALSNTEQEWLNSHIIPLPKMLSVAEEQPDWKNYFGDFKLLGLGEFSHSTSEVFTAKASIIKQLVLNKQLHIIAWESGFAEAEIFNNCLQTKDCDVKSAFKKMISQPWYNEEVIALLQWIQNYNISAEEPVTFTGFDMQRNKAAFNRLMHFAIVKNDKLLIKKLQKYYAAEENNYKVNPNYSITNTKVAESLKKKAAEIKRAFVNIDDSAWVKQYAELLYQSGLTWATEYPVANDLRDSFMAQNIMYIQSQNTDKKIVVWAHNLHISNSKMWMGSYLKATYGDKYKIVGFSSRKGNYGSWKEKPIILAEPDPRCYEHFFPEIDFLFSLIEARKSPGKETQWLKSGMLFRSSNWLSDLQFDPSVLANDYDFIYHIEETSASKDF